MNIYTIATITFLAVTLSAGAYIFYKKNTPVGLQQYVNTEHGISFEYPSGYKLTETPHEHATGTHIVLVDRGFRMPENGEGPTAITVDIFDDIGIQASKQKTVAEQWIASSTYSNWNISDMEVPGQSRVASSPAWLYTWDGLYRGISLVTERNGSIFMFSVTYDGESDLAKREAFTDLVESVRFSDASTSTPSSSANE